MVCGTHIKVLAFFFFLVFGTITCAHEIYVEDKLKKRIVVDIPLRRAVIIITYELIPALNIWAQVSGVSRWAEESCSVYKAIVKENPSFTKPKVGSGTDLNAESILKLNPDLIITWTYHLDTIKYFEKRGLKVLCIYPESIQELYKDIRLHGQLFGKEKKAEEVIGEMERMFKLIRHRVEEIPEKKRKKVIHLLGSPTRVSGGVGITNDIIKICGAKNVAEEISYRNADVSVERIVQWNPDVIFIWGNAGYNESWLMRNSQWQSIRAVQEGKVFKLPKWSTWSPRLAPISLYMATKIYPDRFGSLNFEKIVDDFYRRVFGITYNKVKNEEN